MDMIPVDSSNLLSVGYNAATYDLYIKFRDGSVYVYSGVPENLYRGLMNANSKGSYASAYIYNAFLSKRT